jgi:F0F1-type ATP synthase membrane subunit b/b'
VKYRGQIGEFKVRGFVTALVVYVAFGYFVYSRFSFVTVPKAANVQMAVDQALRQANNAESNTTELRNQVIKLQDQMTSMQMHEKPCSK